MGVVRLGKACQVGIMSRDNLLDVLMTPIDVMHELSVGSDQTIQTNEQSEGCSGAER